jgi:hypothetical protein
MTKFRQASEIEDALVGYRLLGSPVLRQEHRSAKVLGALARMELGPVTSAWFSRRTGLKPKAALALLEDICAQGCAQRITIAGDADSRFTGFSQTGSSDFAELSDPRQYPRTRLRSAFDFLRRVVM